MLQFIHEEFFLHLVYCKSRHTTTTTREKSLFFALIFLNGTGGQCFCSLLFNIFTDNKFVLGRNITVNMVCIRKVDHTL